MGSEFPLRQLTTDGPGLSQIHQGHPQTLEVPAVEGGDLVNACPDGRGGDVGVSEVGVHLPRSVDGVLRSITVEQSQARHGDDGR